MTGPVFLDTGYILAAINSADNFHGRAQTAAAQVKPPFITTEAVLNRLHFICRDANARLDAGSHHRPAL